ncbi:MAG TPA: hypothetical protein VJS47_08290 [Rhizomicrobium sp.]|nr:hypothetical protein [Rhizomicrobium sp.]
MRRFKQGALAPAIACVFAVIMLSGCAISPYVDNGLGELRPEDKVTVANPKPVQLLFEFQTKGVGNGRATDFLKTEVLTAVQGSGLFLEPGPAPVSDGALLHIVINNVVLTDDAFSKGFTTGLTLGLAGTTVADGYICTVDYLAGGTKKIEQVTRDVIYGNIGAKEAPPHAEKVASLEIAIKTVTRRMVSHALNDLARNPEFPK